MEADKEKDFPRYWRAFTFKGVEFLAVRFGNSLHVVDSKGNNYGSYMGVESFKKFYIEAPQPLGVIRELSVRTIPS